MKKKRISSVIVLLLSSILIFAQNNLLPETSVSFETNDSKLQKLYDRAEELLFKNISDFEGRKILVEGAVYPHAYLETQPMGGYMFAKRNIEVAKNNIELFLDHQRKDGRLPCVIYHRRTRIEPNYAQLQGFFLPIPAYELYFLLGKDTSFLHKVYKSLESFDEYLWKVKDSDNDGCLESWCMYDTGEDHSVRFNGFPNAWYFDFPPSKEKAAALTEEELRIHCKEYDKYDQTKEMVVPIESMDVMSYSYTGRLVLSLISKELNNGKEHYWKAKADSVQTKVKSYLWDENKKACFDKDKNNKTMPILLHNNLRCMYFGSFDQEMADDFIKHHLMNPKEFWTPMPLPSIAVNDSNFRNISGNNWSGQPQGLTYQRSIRAMENYGHYAELTLIGKNLLDVLDDSLKFVQQFDPFTATINNSTDGYGPSILATLEFISRFYGVHITQDKIYWSCLNTNYDYTYTQTWNKMKFTLETKGEQVYCKINGVEKFSFTKGTRVISDLNGDVIEIVGIQEEPKTIKLRAIKDYEIAVVPNAIYRLSDNGLFEKYKESEFYNPEAQIGDISTAAKTIKDAKLTIYPNPVDDGKFTLVFGENHQSAIYLMSVDGKLIKRIRSTNKKVEFSLEGHEKGLYILKVISKNKIRTIKILYK